MPEEEITQQNQEKKPERIDELDVIGGGILRIITAGVKKIVGLVTKSKNS